MRSILYCYYYAAIIFTFEWISSALAASQQLPHTNPSPSSTTFSRQRQPRIVVVPSELKLIATLLDPAGLKLKSVTSTASSATSSYSSSSSSATRYLTTDSTARNSRHNDNDNNDETARISASATPRQIHGSFARWTSNSVFTSSRLEPFARRTGRSPLQHIRQQHYPQDRNHVRNIAAFHRGRLAASTSMGRGGKVIAASVSHSSTSSGSGGALSHSVSAVSSLHHHSQQRPLGLYKVSAQSTAAFLNVNSLPLLSVVRLANDFMLHDDNDDEEEDVTHRLQNDAQKQRKSQQKLEKLVRSSTTPSSSSSLSSYPSSNLMTTSLASVENGTDLFQTPSSLAPLDNDKVRRKQRSETQNARKSKVDNKMKKTKRRKRGRRTRNDLPKVCKGLIRVVGNGGGLRRGSGMGRGRWAAVISFPLETFMAILYADSNSGARRRKKMGKQQSQRLLMRQRRLANLADCANHIISSVRHGASPFSRSSSSYSAVKVAPPAITVINLHRSAGSLSSSFQSASSIYSTYRYDASMSRISTRIYRFIEALLKRQKDIMIITPNSDRGLHNLQHCAAQTHTYTQAHSHTYSRSAAGSKRGGIRCLLQPRQQHRAADPNNLNKTSVLFVTISFILLMVISLAWLIFYYVQRFRIIHTKEQFSRRLAHLAKKAVAKIPLKTLKQGDRELEMDFNQCAICIEGFHAGETLRLLPCRHYFHKNCIDPWLLEQRSCPMCKTNILQAYGLISMERGSLLSEDQLFSERESSAAGGVGGGGGFAPSASALNLAAGGAAGGEIASTMMTVTALGGGLGAVVSASPSNSMRAGAVSAMTANQAASLAAAASSTNSSIAAAAASSHANTHSQAPPECVELAALISNVAAASSSSSFYPMMANNNNNNNNNNDGDIMLMMHQLHHHQHPPSLLPPPSNQILASVTNHLHHHQTEQARKGGEEEEIVSSPPHNNECSVVASSNCCGRQECHDVTARIAACKSAPSSPSCTPRNQVRRTRSSTMMQHCSSVLRHLNNDDDAII